MRPRTRTLLRSYFADLVAAPRTKVKDLGRIRRDCPSIGGVYAIWNGMSGGRPIYVGETCHLNHRLRELSAMGRHAFFRTYIKANNISPVAPAKSSHPAWSRLTLSCLPMEVGRAELEDFLVGVLEPDYNSKPVRLRMRADAVDFERKAKWAAGSQRERGRDSSA